MPIFYSDIANNQNDAVQLTKERQSDGSKVSGDLLVATATYTFAGTEVNADVINIVKLPEGATVIPGLCKVITNLTATVDADLTIGDDDATTAADADRYSTTLTIDEDAGTRFDFTPGAAADVTPYELQTPSWIQATLAGLANVTADDTLTFIIVYKAQS